MKKQNGAFFRFKKEMVDSDREIEWDENEGNFSKICKNSIFVQYIFKNEKNYVGLTSLLVTIRPKLNME